MTAQRREQLACFTALALLWALFVVIAAWAIPTHDDWYQRGWLRDGGGLSFDLLARELRYNYFHANPRIGDVFLLAVNGSTVIHAVITPLAQLTLLGTAFIAAFGRLPRATYRDLTLLLVLQVVIWLASPLPGVVYFYRPYTTNYLFAFATTLSVFVPYRLAVAAPGDAPRRPWLVPVLLVLGVVAGLSNEHTGPTAIAAIVVVIAWAWRQPRLRAARSWMIAGALGLIVGYLMLLYAPGQAERYAGRSARFSALGLIASRGVAGNYDVLANFVGEVQWAVDLVIAAVLWFVIDGRRRGDAAGLPRTTAVAVAGLIAAAGSIVVTLFASPVTTERLLFAPAVLLACGLAAVVEHAITARRVRIAVTCACAVLGAYHAVRFVQVYAAARRDGLARLARLAAAAPGTTVVVPPYTTPRSRWFRGDDFWRAEVREYVAHELYGLADIEIAPRPNWMEASYPGTYTGVRTYEAPQPPETARASAFGSTALMRLRQHLALDGWLAQGGHRLASYRIDGVATGFDDPKHRPFHVLEWTPDAITFVNGERYEDEDRQPGFRLWPPALPAGTIDAYVIACGATTPVPLLPELVPPHDLLLPLRFTCRGPYVGAVCTASDCWLAGRYWR